VIDQVRAEIIKIRSTRTTIGLMLGTLALTASITLLSGLLQHARDISSIEDQRQLLGIGSIAGLFAALAGVLVVTSEYRFGTIRPTFLVTPSWRRIHGGKVVASFVSGVVFGVVGTGLSYAIGYLCLSSRNIHFALDTRDSVLLLAGSIGGAALWGAIGVGVGTIIRNQIGSVIALLAWGFVVESLLFALLPSVGRWTPGEAQNAMQGSTADHLLSPGLGTLAMLVWLAALAAIGVAWTSRRDVA
jgi:ABC-2 type transport system permease protein